MPGIASCTVIQNDAMPNNRDISIRLFSGITPVEGTEETVRVVAMEKDFHVDCYVCEVPLLIL